jgi:hypothetical protein
MTNNVYVDALRKFNINKVEMKVSPRKEIAEYQRDKCYICERSMKDSMRYFCVIQGPDPKTGIPSKENRAVCASCRFKLGNNPIKQTPKPKEEKIKSKEYTDEELERMDLKDILK